MQSITPQHVRAQRMPTLRWRILLCFFLLCALYFAATIFRMQVFDYDTYQQKVIRQITVGSSLTAERGEITDRNGKLLATNQTVWRIYISPVDISKRSKKDGTNHAKTIAQGLGTILSVDQEVIYKKAGQSRVLDQTIYRNATKEQAEAVLRFATQNDLSDMIHTEPGTRRFYPFSTLASHTIGFTGSDGQGLFGLEAYYNEVLMGENGKYMTAVDSRGIMLPSEYRDYTAGKKGATLKTTLDVYIQQQLEYQLEQARLHAGAQNRTTGIVMHVKTGAILAMATSPSFDLNQPYTLDDESEEKLNSSGLSPTSEEYKAKKNALLYEMWRNKAVTEIYEPGSTFKIVTAAIGLETGAVSENTPFSCPGYAMVGGRRISCHKRTGHGHLNFAQGLQQSCNPTMMQTAERIGKDNFYAYYRAFGYLEKTGIDLPGEGSGIFHDSASLGSTELATASFGQRFKVSVLQQLCAVAAVANGGVLVTPHCMQAICDENGKELFCYQTQQKRQVISAQTASRVSAILEAGVSGDGGAKNAFVSGYHIAAKTGTSEKFDILDANGQSFLRIGSCVAFAPYDGAEIAAIFIVDEPTSQNKYGSTVAAPYISALFSSILPYLGLEQEKSEQTLIPLPDTIGLSPTLAKAALSKLGLSVELIGQGDTVLAQMPPQGTKLDPMSGVVILYTQALPEEVTVPSLLGKTTTQANELLTQCGLNVRFLGVSQHKLQSGATVTAQSLPPGSRAKRGSVITLTLFFQGDTS